MIQITVPEGEYYDEKHNEFIVVKETTIALEHSLLSISKWESKWHKPYLSKEEKTLDEIADYIRCMTITKNVDPMVYNNLTESNIKEILDYLSDPMTATTFSDESEGKGRRNRVITSELIYYWMISNGIPFECQKWHIHRLLTLIRVCGTKNQPQKKMSKSEWANKQRNLNAARRAALHSKG